MIAIISAYVLISLLFGFVGALTIAFYTQINPKPFKALLHFCLSSKLYRIYFVLLCIFSFSVLFWFDIGFMYAVLMLLLLLGLIDIKCLAVPDVLNFALLLLCVIYAFIESMGEFGFDDYVFGQRIMLGFGVGGLFFVLKIFYQSLRQKDIIGEADIIVLSALGIAFGVVKAFIIVFVGSIIALIYAIFLKIFYNANLTTLRLPFCFFIFLSVLFLLIAAIFML